MAKSFTILSVSKLRNSLELREESRITNQKWALLHISLSITESMKETASTGLI